MKGVKMMAKIIDFEEAKSKILSVYNPLQAWRSEFLKELAVAGYTISVLDELFPNNKVDESEDIYHLNEKIKGLSTGEKIVLVRNHHFELFFYLSNERELTLRIGALASGIDAILLQNKFHNEKKIFTKYHQLLLGYFGKEPNLEG